MINDMKNNNKSTKRIYYSPEMIMSSDYYQYPKWLMGVDMSNDSKTLYVLLLDKYKLSLKNGWIDEDNRVYCYFSKESVQNILRIGKTKCYELFKELDELNFIEQVRQGQGKNNRLYLKSVDFISYSQTSEKRTSENFDTEYRLQTSEKRMSRCSDNGHQDVRKTNCSKNELNNNKSDSDSENKIYSLELSKKETETETIMDDDAFLRNLTNEQYIAFEELLNKIKKRDLNSSKASLIAYFKKLKKNDWKDLSGDKIRNIVSYVTMNFVCHDKDVYKAEMKLREQGFEPGSSIVQFKKETGRNKKEDILVEYDTSNNPEFDEGRYNEIMARRRDKNEGH